jgi:shikimate dehydrogenase
MSPSAATRVFALLGDPVAHSFSPRMQNAAFRAAGIDAVYVALRCDAAEAVGLIRGIARAGGGGNVTLPHKGAALAAIEVPTRAVTGTGACNTFWLERGRVHGDNTDVAGFARAATAVVDTLAGARVLVLGAGGGAAAALRALIDAEADRVTLLSRTPERAARLAALQDVDGRVVRVVAQGELRAAESWDLVVNATPLGLRPGDPLPLDLDRAGRIGAVFDMAYGRSPTPWVCEARARGIPACDGLEMLVEQGGAAFRDWFGVEPPVSAMRDAIARS